MGHAEDVPFAVERVGHNLVVGDFFQTANESKQLVDNHKHLDAYMIGQSLKKKICDA